MQCIVDQQEAQYTVVGLENGLVELDSCKLEKCNCECRNRKHIVVGLKNATIVRLKNTEKKDISRIQFSETVWGWNV